MSFDPMAMYGMVRSMQAAKQADADRAQAQQDRLDAIRRHEQDRLAQRAEQQRNFLLQAIQSGASVDKMLGMAPDVPSGEIPAFRELEKVQKRRAAEAEQEQTLPALGQLVGLAKTKQDQFAAQAGVRNMRQQVEDPQVFADLMGRLGVIANQQRVVDQANVAGENRAMGRQRQAQVAQLAASGQNDFVKAASDSLAADSSPANLARVEQDAVTMFGKDGARVVMPQIRNQSIAATAAQLDSNEAIKLYVDDGASPSIAPLAAKGKAWKSPLLGVYARGSENGKIRNSHVAMGQLVEQFEHLEAAVEDLALSGGANLATKPLYDILRSSAAKTDPKVAAVDAWINTVAVAIANAKSGLAMPEQQVQRFESLLTRMQEATLGPDGKLQGGAQARVDAIRKGIDAELIAPFDYEDRKRARKVLDERRKAIREEVRSDPTNGLRGAGPSPAAEQKYRALVGAPGAQ